MKRACLFFAVLMAGCSPTPPPTASVPQLEVKTQPFAGEPTPKTDEQKPATVKPEVKQAEPFRFASDTGGKAVEKLSQPKLPLAAQTKTAAPTPRSSEVERGELPPAKPSVVAVTLPAMVRKGAIPPPPKESVPPQLGVGFEFPLRDRKLPESATVKAPPRPAPTAADVPRSANQLPERASLEDPTAEISMQRIVNTLMVAQNVAAPFLRLVLPNPFEFAEQVKPPTAPEFATSPVFVPSAKP